jgi:hypothetical protein
MKITWFAAMTLRIQIAGRTVVIHADDAPDGVDVTELIGGAQTLVSTENPDLADFDPETWRPRRRARLIDREPGDEALDLYRLGIRGLVADSADEGLLVVEDADAAVQCAAHGTALLDIARPRLIALAVTDGEVDIAFDTLAPLLGGASLIVLEPGLAVEV